MQPGPTKHNDKSLLRNGKIKNGQPMHGPASANIFLFNRIISS